MKVIGFSLFFRLLLIETQAETERSWSLFHISSWLVQKRFVDMVLIILPIFCACNFTGNAWPLVVENRIVIISYQVNLINILDYQNSSIFLLYLFHDVAMNLIYL